MRKKILPLILLLLLALGAVAGQAEDDALSIRGYVKKDGYQYVQFGTYYTDADGGRQPIVWRVLRVNDGEAYILSELILFGCPLHGDYYNYNRNWKGSDLYAYLNGAFKDDAFSPAEQAVLLVRTEDDALVTLLTSEEMKDKALGFAGNQDRLCKSTEWAKLKRDPLWPTPQTNGGKWKPLYTYSKGKRQYSPWWSRTPSPTYSHEQIKTKDEGKLGRLSVGNTDVGARPAVTLDLSKLTIVSGAGTLDSPFVLAVADAEIPDASETETALPEDTDGTEETEDVSDPDVDESPDTSEDADADAPDAADTADRTSAPAAAHADGVIAYTAGADPQYIRPEFPTLTEEGFLPEGEAEFVYKDPEGGLWLYASQDLRIQIERKSEDGTITYTKKAETTGKTRKITANARWFETRIFCRDSATLPDFFPVDEETYAKRHPATKLAEEIARDYHLVLGMNTDKFDYRVERSYEKGANKNTLKNYYLGIIIRNGKIIFEKTKKEKTEDLPPLDSIAFYPDGRTTVHVTSSTTAEKLSKAGATDVASFGPVLVENGQVSPRASMYGKVVNPRAGFGTVEPGHYVHVLAEGRLGESLPGVTCVWLAEKLVAMGCDNALNFDGGASCALVFMGEQINTVGNYAGGTAKDRQYNELLGIGQSDAVK